MFKSSSIEVLIYIHIDLFIWKAQYAKNFARHACLFVEKLFFVFLAKYQKQFVSI
jgi:hypothetical protein